ncbi:MAG: LabA-like NYN domain-containing protein [Armatimonadota bacterium]
MYSRDTWKYERGILIRQPPLRVSIFVDGANMYYAQKRLGWFIDFRKVLHYFGPAQGNVISEAYYYTGADNATLARDMRFHEYLMYSGYIVRTKNIKQVIDDTTGEVVEKANLDVELVIDMFNTLNLFDMCVLMSGDGDFERALELLRCKGKRVAVVAHPEMTARELRNVVGRNYFDLREMAPHFARTDRMPEYDEMTTPRDYMLEETS